LLSRSGAGRYWWIWIAVAPILAWTAIRLTGRELGYPMVGLIAFTPFVAIGAFLAAGLALALRNWAAMGLAAAATLCLAVAVLPRAVGSSAVDPAGHETLTVLSANIHRGTADPAVLVALVDRYRPDLLSVQELTPSSARELRTAGLTRRLPNQMLRVSRGASGAGLYARRPLRPLADQTRFFFRMPRALLILPSGSRLRVVGVHPYPPLKKRVGIWRDTLESLPSGGSGDPWLLAGDFNATLDHAELREVVDRGYRDAAAVTGRGLEPTWPTSGHRLIPPSIAIDHLLADERLGIVDYAVLDLPGSDHRAIYAEIVLPKPATL
jgi:endonuclease/exonuclease/phosphatase (EEP) superfamily protein YafD